MRLTNELGLPQPIVDAVNFETAAYDGPRFDGDDNHNRISVTSLLKPAQSVAIEREHHGEMTEDVADRLWALQGQVVHGILERAAKLGAHNLAEKRLEIVVDGWTISGRFDHFLLHTGILQDWKYVSVYSIKDGVKPEFVEQLNVYAEMLHTHGHVVAGAQIVAILRDWSKMATLRERNYPERQVVVLNVPLWSSEKTRAFISARLAEHVKARDGSPTPCTDEERWARGEAWAVKKDGRKRAVKLHDSLEEADVHAMDLGRGHSVEHRKPVSTRCASWCRALQWCSQGQAAIAVDE